MDAGAIVENKRLGNALRVAQVLQPQRDDRRSQRMPSRTNSRSEAAPETRGERQEETQQTYAGRHECSGAEAGRLSRLALALPVFQPPRHPNTTYPPSASARLSPRDRGISLHRGSRRPIEATLNLALTDSSQLGAVRCAFSRSCIQSVQSIGPESNRRCRLPRTTPQAWSK